MPMLSSVSQLYARREFTQVFFERKMSRFQPVPFHYQTPKTLTGILLVGRVAGLGAENKRCSPPRTHFLHSYSFALIIEKSFRKKLDSSDAQDQITSHLF
jgi:hypothetical protein